MKIKLKFPSFALFAFAFLLFQIPAYGNFNESCHLELTDSEMMRTTRIDRHAPCSCKPFHLKQFKNSEIDYFVGGINSTKGADQQIDLERSEARTLWYALKESRAAGRARRNAKDKLAKDPQLLEYYNQLLAIKDLHGFTFGNEGEVLEALSILSLENQYPKDKYFATGGIMYFPSSGPSTLGELDLVVYEKASCKVVLVGEAKLSRNTGKAREQLTRFQNFLRSQGQN